MHIITTPRGPMRAVPVYCTGGDLIAFVPVDGRDLRRLLHCELPHFDAATPTPPVAYVAPRAVLPSTATISPCACAQSVGGAW